MKTKSIVIGTGTCGILAGFLLSGSIGKNDIAKIATVATLLGIPTAVVAHSLGESKGNNRANELEDKLSRVEVDAGCTRNELKKASEKTHKLGIELASIKQELEQITLQRDGYRVMTEAEKPVLEGLRCDLEKAQQSITNWEIRYRSLEQRNQESFEKEVQDRLKKAKTDEIAKLSAANDEITDGAMEALERLNQWAFKIREKHDGRKIYNRQLRENFLEQLNLAGERIDDVNRASQQEQEKYLEQIDCLHQRIALLQQKVASDLVEPEYGHFGYQWDARIADDIARQVWASLHIPLSVKGYRINPDGSAEAGYGYSRSQSVEALVSDLSRLSRDIAKGLGIHEISSIRKHELSDLLIISWRCERPKPPSDEAIYRIMEPASVCTALIRDAMNHRKGGKPTLRVMGATGEGKGILARALLADWVKSESGEVWLSDPMDGSAEDRWEVPKAGKSSSESRKLIKDFEGEFKNRKNKASSRKDVQILGFFDEFDNEHPQEDKELVKGIWTAIRHHKMKLILMGQDSEVGKNGWRWDEMKNCACLFVGSSIGTARKHLTKDLGFSNDVAKEIERKHDLIKAKLAEKNASLGLEGGEMYRVALLVVGETYKFLELPSAFKEKIESDKAIIVNHPWESVIESKQEAITVLRVCPGCGGKLRKAGLNLRCENRNHTKDMGLKTFHIDG
jgi:hypothetical protein